MIKAVLQKRQIAAIAVLALPYYFCLLTDFGHRVDYSGVALNLVFNSMLDHLLAGRFDVDPAIVGLEGFTRDGQVYAYWGIFPAILRLPLLAFPNWKSLDATLLSCLIAVTITLVGKLWALRIVAKNYPDIPVWLVASTAAVLVFSGAQIGFLRVSVYQEVCFWAGAFAAIFVAAAVGCVAKRGFDRNSLILMSIAAGLTLLTRVSIAVGLYAALGLLLSVILFRSRGRNWRAVAPPLAIMLGFVAICAFVNFERWGNPATFADYSLYNYNIVFPDRLLRTTEYGLFNLGRLPFGLMYYFLPVWFLHDRPGHLLFEQTQTRLIDAVELPPSSFLMTDMVLIAFLIVAIWSARKSLTLRFETLAIAIGLMAPPLLMLTAISMNYRYRMDFYPLFEFGGFLGLVALVDQKAIERTFTRRSIYAAAAVSILASHCSMALYRMSDLGPAQAYLGDGILSYYGHQL